MEIVTGLFPRNQLLSFSILSLPGTPAPRKGVWYESWTTGSRLDKWQNQNKWVTFSVLWKASHSIMFFFLFFLLDFESTRGSKDLVYHFNPESHYHWNIVVSWEQVIHQLCQCHCRTHVSQGHPKQTMVWSPSGSSRSFTYNHRIKVWKTMFKNTILFYFSIL